MGRLGTAQQFRKFVFTLFGHNGGIVSEGKKAVQAAGLIVF
jgi:hypothetical protein